MDAIFQRIKNSFLPEKSLSDSPLAAKEFTVLEELGIGVAVISKEGILEFVNSYFLALDGGSIGQDLWQTPLYKDEELNKLILAALKGNPFRTEVLKGSPEARDKRYFRYSGRPVMASGGKALTRLILTVEEITANKRLESDAQDYIRKLKDDELRFVASINSLPLGFIIVDVRSNILIKNQVVDKILDLTEMEGNVFLKGDIEEIENKLRGYYDLKGQWEKSLREGKVIGQEVIAFGPKFLRLFIAPVKLTETKEAIGVVILIEDVTEAKIFERSRDEFFSIASHELRTPLTAIKGNTALIKEYYADKIKDTDLAEMIADIHDSSDRLIAIVNDFLDMGRLEQGKMQFKKETLDLVKLIETVIKEYQVTGSQKKLALSFRPPPLPLPAVTGDSDKVKQVLVNLVGNGLKFTEQGGVTVEIQVVPGFVRVLVADTGSGVPPAGQNLLFHKFQQAGPGLLTRDATRGTGLGLYISKLIVEGMGGDVWLEKSEVGKGSTFAFSLPRADAEAGAV